MALSTVTQPAGVNAGGPAVAFVSANTRAKSQMGFLGIQTDVVQFAGPMVTGAWITAGTRVFVQHIPVILQSSTGTAVNPVAAAPMTVVMGDPRVAGT
jgi:hypothetical protein